MIIGHLLNERYRIEKRIGGGGMANVYLAYDLILERNVAIKALRSEFVNDPEFVERFDREAQAATSLSHPNVVSIYDVGEEEDILFIVMEYVDGLTLKEYIQREGPLAVEKAIDIMQQLTSAIQHAHENGLIHRDIKPQNVLIDHHGTVKVTDFGIAIALSATALTQTNSVLGSVHYLSPEQARGGKATNQSDIYSLGIVFFELVTGKLPFSGQSPVSIALKHLQNETPSVRAMNPLIPQSVENIILKATAKDPFHRFHTVAEMERVIAHSLDPANRNEPAYQPPTEVGDETKAIPIIREGQLADSMLEEDSSPTLVHHLEDQRPEKNLEDENKDKAQTVKKQKKSRKWILGLSAFLLISLMIFLFFILSSPKDVVIPDVIDLEYDEASQALKALNLKVTKETAFSKDIEAGHIVKTEPAVGKTVKEKSTVKLYVSEGKEKLVFGNHVGETITQARSILEAKGFKEIQTYDVISDEPIGRIVRQLQPEAGSEVVPEDTVVIFEVSGGPKSISLGNLIGLSLSEVQDYASKNKLALSVKEVYDDQVEKGKVLAQEPNAYRQVEEGSKLTVTVSKGKEAKPPRSKTVSFKVPFQPKIDSNGQQAKEQLVQIYVGDMNEHIDHVFHEAYITNDKEYELTLIVAEGQVAEYRVLRDGVQLYHEKIPY